MEMVKVRTSDLIGAALDWAVAKAQGVEIELPCSDVVWAKYAGVYSPSTDWSQGGPLIEKYGVAIDYRKLSKLWDAHCSAMRGASWMNSCKTPLIAACRAIVSAHLGDSVDVPAELVGGGV